MRMMGVPHTALHIVPRTPDKMYNLVNRLDLPPLLEVCTVCLSVCLTDCLSVCLSVCLFVCLSVYVHMYFSISVYIHTFMLCLSDSVCMNVPTYMHICISTLETHIYVCTVYVRMYMYACIYLVVPIQL